MISGRSRNRNQNTDNFDAKENEDQSIDRQDFDIDDIMNE